MARVTKDSVVDTTPLATESQNDGVQETPVEKPVEKPKANKTGVKVVSLNKKIRQVYGLNGLIDFDNDGVAYVSQEDADRFANIPGFEVK